MKKVELNKGLFTLVDDDIAEQWGGMAWYVDSVGYVALSFYDKTSQLSVPKRLHRLILDARKGEVVDHINQNKLDNRRSNLRKATQAQNLWNTGLPKHNKSGFKGVSWDKTKGKWTARIREGNKYLFLGRFNSKERAAEAWQTKAKEIRGDFFHP